MVQRKTSHDRLDQEHGRILEPEMMKRPRPSKPTTPERQIVARVKDEPPNYMKGTSSSEARRQSQGVQAGLDKKIQTGKKLDSCSGSKKKTSNSSSSKSLEKGLSFKRSCGRIAYLEDVHAQRTTCSSFLKNSKLPKYLMLTSPDILKLCPYKYCSLSAHLHLQLQPLKSFISARGSTSKSQKSVRASGDDDFVDIYVEEKKEYEVENGNTREVDIQKNDFEAEDMGMDSGGDEDKDKRDDDLSSESAEMVSLQEGEGIRLKEDYCKDDFETLVDAESCSSDDGKIGMKIDNFAVLELSENASEDQESDEGTKFDNSISFLLPDIQDDIIHCLLGNALDENFASKKAEDREEAGGEKAIKLVLKTEEALLTFARKPCNREEHNENWRKFKLRKPNCLPVFDEQSNEKVVLKQDMDCKKNAEEWMTDYALQKAISKLALEKKNKVALLVEAFETTIPRVPSQASFTYGRYLITG